MLLGIELNYLVHRLPVAQARRELHELLVHCRFLIRSHNYGVAVRVGSCEIAGYGAEGDIILVIVFLYIVLADRLFAALVIDIIEKSVARGVGGLYLHERLLRHAELLIVARKTCHRSSRLFEAERFSEAERVSPYSESFVLTATYSQHSSIAASIICSFVASAASSYFRGTREPGRNNIKTSHSLSARPRYSARSFLMPNSPQCRIRRQGRAERR